MGSSPPILPKLLPEVVGLGLPGAKFLLHLPPPRPKGVMPEVQTCDELRVLKHPAEGVPVLVCRSMAAESLLWDASKHIRDTSIWHVINSK